MTPQQQLQSFRSLMHKDSNGQIEKKKKGKLGPLAPPRDHKMRIEKPNPPQAPHPGGAMSTSNRKTLPRHPSAPSHREIDRINPRDEEIGRQQGQERRRDAVPCSRGRGWRGATEEETGERVSPAPPRDDAAGGRGVGREETLEKG